MCSRTDTGVGKANMEVKAFRSWLSGWSHDFVADMTTDGRTLEAVDRGTYAVYWWIPISVVAGLLLGVMCYDNGIPFVQHGFRQADKYPLVLALIAALGAYRTIRTFARTSKCVVDLDAQTVSVIETWPKRRRRTAALSQCRLVIQPVLVTDALRLFWPGAALVVHVGDTAFTLACKGTPEDVLKATPAEMVDLFPKVEEATDVLRVFVPI